MKTFYKIDFIFKKIRLIGSKKSRPVECNIKSKHIFPIEPLKCIIVWHSFAYKTLFNFSNDLNLNNNLIVRNKNSFLLKIKKINTLFFEFFSRISIMNLFNQIQQYNYQIFSNKLHRILLNVTFISDIF